MLSITITANVLQLVEVAYINTMKIILKYRKYDNPKTYFAFNLIDLKYINTFQVWSINFTFCNLLLKILNVRVLCVRAEFWNTNV